MYITRRCFGDRAMRQYHCGILSSGPICSRVTRRQAQGLPPAPEAASAGAVSSGRSIFRRQNEARIVNTASTIPISVKIYRRIS